MKLNWRLAGSDPAMRLSAPLRLTTNRDFGGHLTDYRDAIPSLRCGRYPYSFACRIHAAAAVLMIALTVACAPKGADSLSPRAVKLWQADEAAVALGTLQRTAIQLNRAEILSENNTRHVVTTLTPALRSLKAQPEAWRPLSKAAVDEAERGLDTKGKQTLAPHIAAARSTLNGL